MRKGSELAPLCRRQTTQRKDSVPEQDQASKHAGEGMRGGQQPRTDDLIEERQMSITADQASRD